MAHASPKRANAPVQFHIALSNQQRDHTVNEALLIDAARAVLSDSTFSSAEISIAIVDDDKIQELNRRHLNHDWPTDVLSFPLDDDGKHLNAEIIVSADTAATAAQEFGHSADGTWANGRARRGVWSATPATGLAGCATDYVRRNALGETSWTGLRT